MLLKEVSNEQARAKVGIFGMQGSGKTTTNALLALGVSLTFHGGAPIAMMDTENGSDYLKPIFDAEGVKLLVHKAGAFSDMAKVLAEAEAVGCCAFIMDSVTHTWRELQDTYCAQMCLRYKCDSYDIQFQDWRELKAQWATWTYVFLNSNLHCFICGRAGYEYEYQTNDKGKKELIKGNSKMKAENEFGYEPSLLIELEGVRSTTNKKKTGGTIKHIAYVLKDRSRSLNGMTFEWPDINKYEKGDWKKIYSKFAPYFAFLNVGGTQKAMLPNTSEDLFDPESNNTEARQRQQSKKIALEEIENILGVVLFPGATNEVKRIKLVILQQLFGVRSWTAIEGMGLKQIEDGLWALQEFEKAFRDAQPNGLDAIQSLLKECTEKVSRPKYIPGRQEGSMAAPKASIPPYVEPSPESSEMFADKREPGE